MDLVAVGRVAPLDIVVASILIAGVLIGLLQGVIRQTFLLASVYFGMVLAAQYYRVAAHGLALALPGGHPTNYSIVGVLSVFVLTVVAFNAVSYLACKSTTLSLATAMERLAGGVLGGLSAWLFLSLMLTVTNFGLSARFVGMEGAQVLALRLMDDSTMVSALHRSMPALYETIRPWIPAGLPAPFSA